MVRSTAKIVAQITLALALVLSLTGCDVLQQVTVRLVDFDTKDVEGISLWRHDAATGQWERRYVVRFGTPYLKDGVEYVDYQLLNSDGSEFASVPAELMRDPAAPGSAELSIVFFVYDDPSDFKMAAFNAQGESGLSQETITM